MTAKAKDAAKATELLEALKAHGLRQMEAEPGALRFTVFMPGGDLPPQFTDDVTVRFIETWAKPTTMRTSRRRTSPNSARSWKN